MGTKKTCWIAVIAAILSASQPLASDWPPMVVVWNVGQGQWVTISTNTICDHLDLGGDRLPSLAPIRLCSGKLNRLWLSHSDWDHIGGIGRFRLPLAPLCLAAPYLGTSSPAKQRLIQSLSRCPQSLGRPGLGPDLIWRPLGLNLKSNSLSQIFSFHSLLVPGDSTAREEKIWKKDLPERPIEYLVLGHHGSRTSTSEGLIEFLTHLRQAIASSRRTRYGHPHPEVVSRLRRHGAAVVSTEDWGHIRLDF